MECHCSSEIANGPRDGHTCNNERSMNLEEIILAVNIEANMEAAWIVKAGI